MDNITWSLNSSYCKAAGKLFENTEKNGIHVVWKSLLDVSKSDTKQHVYFAWKFEWDELKKQGFEGFEGTITLSYQKRVLPNGTCLKFSGFPKTFSVQLTRSGQWVEHCIGSEKDVDHLLNRDDIRFNCDFDMKPIKKNDESRFLDQTFAASDKTDAILVVEGKKLHVNKQFLSFHSEYFHTLFNSEFKEKSMDEIPIEDVKYEDFSRLLSVVYPNPILPTIENSTSLLKLADRFMMPMVTSLVEPFLIRNENVRICEKIALADKYALKELLETCLDSMKTTTDMKKITETPYFEELSDATKVTILHKLLSFP